MEQEIELLTAELNLYRRRLENIRELVNAALSVADGMRWQGRGGDLFVVDAATCDRLRSLAEEYRRLSEAETSF